jgi:predicted ATPase
VAICPLPTDPGRFEHDLLQAITTGDDDHEVEFAILLQQTSGKSASLCSFLGYAYGVRQL